MSITLWIAIGITGGFFTVLQHDYDPWYRIDFSPGIVFWIIVGSIIWLHSAVKSGRALSENG